MLPPTEHPGVFGQHPNADIASQITETRTLFDTLLSLQPQIPALIDYEGTSSLLQDNSSPLNVVLLQEIQRYNSLLDTIMYGL
uniref:dynein heavy chain 2, axonemal-like n=1 Tax=Monopterus albus TaxID=43700 RepID=UPI0009B3AEF1|nr:dynein heavy chain 2, axonemal-like [Monopterus albus]